MSEKMISKTSKFHVGQKVRCKMDEKTYLGTVKSVETDHILVDIPEVNDHCWFEPGYNLHWVTPIETN